MRTRAVMQASANVDHRRLTPELETWQSSSRFWRAGWCLLATAWFAWTVATAFSLPDPIAIHFGRGGWADSWTSRPRYLLWTLTYGSVLLLLFGLLPRMLVLVPLRWWSLPRMALSAAIPRRYLLGAMQGLLDRAAALLWGFLLLTQVLVVTAHRERPPRLNERALWTGLFLLFVGLAVTLWRFWEHIRTLARDFEAQNTPDTPAQPSR